MCHLCIPVNSKRSVEKNLTDFVSSESKVETRGRKPEILEFNEEAFLVYFMPAHGVGAGAVTNTINLKY